MRRKLAVVSRAGYCRARLGFWSLVGFSSLVGFCAGVVSAPIVLVLQAGKLAAYGTWVFPALMILVGAPIAGAFNGTIMGILAYPLYRWITRRVDLHSYSGEFDVLQKTDGREI
jgi:hypothetical protein